MKWVPESVVKWVVVIWFTLGAAFGGACVHWLEPRVKRGARRVTMGEDFFESKQSPGDRIAAIRAKTIELATLLVSAPVAEMEVLLEDLRESDGGRPLSAAIIELAVSRSRDGGLTADELIVACRNIGYDLTCGQCASVFYTGAGTYPHDSACKTTLVNVRTLQRFRCPEHGLGVNADEDGCCVTCGSDCEVWQLVQAVEA